MKFKVNKRTEEYYNEVLCTLMMENKLKFNPNSKIVNINKFLKTCFFICSLFVILELILLIKDFDIITLIFLIILVLVDFSFFTKYMGYKSRLMFLKSIDFNNSVLIDKNGFKEDKGEYGEVKLEWDNIEFIFINKYSIVLIGKETSDIPYLSYPIESKDDILKGIKKENKEKLVFYTKNV